MNGIDSPQNSANVIECLKSNEVEFVIRYISPNTKNFPTKRMTRTEAVKLSGAGLFLGSVWENLPLDDKEKARYFNRAKGLRDGKFAYTYAKNSIQQPAGSAIYFGVDYDATDEENATTILEYFNGVAEAFEAIDATPDYKIGIYGSGDTCKALLAKKVVTYTWMALSEGWGGFKTFKNWSIKQLKEKRVCKLDSDTDETKADFGQFKV